MMPVEYGGNVSEDFMRKLKKLLIILLLHSKIAAPSMSIGSAYSICL